MAAVISPTKTFHRTGYPSIDPCRPELSARGRTIVVTGGGTGIGAGTALHFAKAGAERIFLLGRREQLLLDTKADIETQFPETEIIAIATDITKIEEVTTAFEKIGSYGPAHVLISNAGALGVLAGIADISMDEWFDGVKTNITGTYNIAKAFLAICAPESKLVNVSSCAAHMNVAPEFSSYNVSKIATSRIYSSLVLEHPEHSFFNIQPGAVDTAMNRASGYKPQEEGEDFQWKGEANAALASHDDVSLPGGFMVWLASPEARFLNGKFLWANWDVDELKTRKEELEKTQLLEIGLIGWPFEMATVS